MSISKLSAQATIQFVDETLAQEMPEILRIDSPTRSKAHFYEIGKSGKQFAVIVGDANKQTGKFEIQQTRVLLEEMPGSMPDVEPVEIADYYEGSSVHRSNSRLAPPQQRSVLVSSQSGLRRLLEWYANTRTTIAANLPIQGARFVTPHDQAFVALGAKAAGQHWSQFDVSAERARIGEAKLLVTTVWNFHHYIDEQGNRVPNENGIARDSKTGTYWYRMDAAVAEQASNTHVAHINRVHLAFENNIPVVGVLKDVKTRRCSLENLFDCIKLRQQLDKKAEWIQLLPRGEIGCAVREIDIGALTGGDVDFQTLQQIEERLQSEIASALHRSKADRAARLSTASRVPRRIEVKTYVYERNPDVVAEVLLRASGNCESCRRPAPFVRKNIGTPYLEVHHRQPLSADGEDSVENAIALCPNCHREKHYG